MKKKKKRQRYCPEEKREEKKKCGDWTKPMCKCTWAFLSIKKKCILHLVLSPFWGENILVVDPRRKHSDPTKHILIGVFFFFCGNTIFVPTFSPHFHFHPYFLILPHLVSKIKKRSHFCPYRHLPNGNSLRGKWSALLAH